MRALLALGSCLASPVVAASEVAIFQSDDLPAYQAPVTPFQDALDRSAHLYKLQGDKSRAEAIAAELKKDPPPLIFAIGAKAAWLARREFPDTPLVYAMIMEPERYGVSGDRVSGVGMTLPLDAVMAQLSVFVPGVHTLGVVVSPAYAKESLAPVKEAAAEAGYVLVVAEVDDTRALRSTLPRLARDVDAFLLVPDAELLTPTNFRAVRDVATRARRPVIAFSESLVRAGALLCVGPDSGEIGREAAALAREMLAAEPGAQAPPTRVPQTTRVVLNRDTLDALGLHLDPTLYDFVDLVVQQPGR